MDVNQQALKVSIPKVFSSMDEVQRYLYVWERLDSPNLAAQVQTDGKRFCRSFSTKIEKVSLNGSGNLVIQLNSLPSTMFVLVAECNNRRGRFLFKDTSDDLAHISVVFAPFKSIFKPDVDIVSAPESCVARP